MPCYKPLDAFYKEGSKPTFKRVSYKQEQISLPCGRCIGCRLERSRQWAVRCLHEAKLHDENCFITLTYDDENVPWDNGLRISHFQKFMKRLRKKLNGNKKQFIEINGQKVENDEYKKVRFYHCGEYGERFKRPHYHACLFGWEPKDKKLFKEANGVRIYTSEYLDKVWGMGFTTVGEVTFESAGYVARYILKKINGKEKEKMDPETGLRIYERVDIQTGEIVEVQPEYTTMSRRPGIGKEWFDKYKDDVYPSDELIVNSRITRPPRFYDDLYQIENDVVFREIKEERRRQQRDNKWNETRERLKVREKVKNAQINFLKRNEVD